MSRPSRKRGYRRHEWKLAREYDGLGLSGKLSADGLATFQALAAKEGIFAPGVLAEMRRRYNVAFRLAWANGRAVVPVATPHPRGRQDTHQERRLERRRREREEKERTTPTTDE